MFIKLNNWLGNKKGVSSVEYVLIIALIVIALIGTFRTFRTQITGVFTRVGAQLDAAPVEIH